MSEWINVIEDNALSDNEHIVVDVDGTDVVIFKLADRLYALENVCTHDGGDIACGQIEGDEIICPRHGARFCIKTGKVKSAPAYEDIECFPLRIEGGMVQIRDSRWD
ncbi:MAG: Rieske 2Fe-2S domain-containing protein [Methylococcales bacterium]|jgi:3-phenylpropionate/trans-cinnamate dioxygenase ferredoxin subunit|nr:Rieske 2Fe-2S domain-containing protein [Methylococcales bacterium]